MPSTRSSTSTVELFDTINTLKRQGLAPWQVIDSSITSMITTGLEVYLDSKAHDALLNAEADDIITMVYLVYSHDHSFNLPASIVRHLNILHRSGKYSRPYSLMVDWAYGYVAEDSESEQVVARWLKRFTFSARTAYQRRLAVYLYLQARALGL